MRFDLAGDFTNLGYQLANRLVTHIPMKFSLEKNRPPSFFHGNSFSEWWPHASIGFRISH
ncbi:MAG: hypothetical protein AB9866_04405 [Syntrophobacteraceae bacterium]